MVEYLKDNRVLSYCKKDSIISFLKNNFEKANYRGLRKDDVIDIAHVKLSADTLGIFASNLPEYGLRKYQIPPLLDCNDYQVAKLIKCGYIRPIVKRAYGYLIETTFYSIMDCLNVMVDRDKYITSKRIASISQTDHNIAQALYIINKSAKRSRDTKQDAYDARQFSVCKGAKTRSMNLYYLKDNAIRKLIEENRIEYIGICRQEVGNHSVYLKFYKIDGFSFHVPYEGHVNEENLLPEINELISSEKKIHTEINYDQAVQVLEDYTGVKATGTFNDYRF